MKRKIKIKKEIFIITFIILIALLVLMVTKPNKQKEEIGENDIGIIEIYSRGIDLIGDPAPEGPRVHPVIKDWDGEYHELDKDKNGKISILNGKIKEMSETTQIYFKENPKSDETIEVNKKLFLKAIEEFIKEHQGTTYHRLDFSDNCIAFKDYTLEKSKIPREE